MSKASNHNRPGPGSTAESKATAYPDPTLERQGKPTGELDDDGHVINNEVFGHPVNLRGEQTIDPDTGSVVVGTPEGDQFADNIGGQANAVNADAGEGRESGSNADDGDGTNHKENEPKVDAEGAAALDTAPLDAPQPKTPGRLDERFTVTPASNGVTDLGVTLATVSHQPEIIDEETGEAPDAGSLFTKVYEHGSTYVVTKRLLERRTMGLTESPITRLLLPKGSTVTEAQVAAIKAQIQSGKKLAAKRDDDRDAAQKLEDEQKAAAEESERQRKAQAKAQENATEAAEKQGAEADPLQPGAVSDKSEGDSDAKAGAKDEGSGAASGTTKGTSEQPVTPGESDSRAKATRSKAKGDK